MKEVYFFTHDSNARNDPKISAMRCQYGYQGYGWYWGMIELLREQEGHKIPLKEYIWSSLAVQLQSTAEDIKKFVMDCINIYELFEADKNCFWSNSLLRRMEKYEEIKEKKKEAAQKRWGKKDDVQSGNPTPPSPNNTDAMQTQCTCITDAMQSDAMKLNEIKLNEIKLNIKAINTSAPSDEKNLSELPEGKPDNFGEGNNKPPEEPNPKPEKPPKISYDDTTGRLVNIPEHLLLKWHEAYPAIDLQVEIAKAETWIITHPKNLKSNWGRFLNSWFDRAQNKARPGNSPPTNGKKNWQDLDWDKI